MLLHYLAATSPRVVHYDDVIMTTIAPQITSLGVVYSTVYSDTNQRKHQSSASLAFVRGIHRDRWIPRTKGQSRGKCFHLMTSSWIYLINGQYCGKRFHVMMSPCFKSKHRHPHYIDVIMTTTASPITSLTVVYSIVYSGADQRKYQSSASLAFVRGIHRDRWSPAQRASNAENVSIWWRHHASIPLGLLRKKLPPWFAPKWHLYIYLNLDI